MTKNEETQKQKPKAPVREMVGVRLLPDTINLPGLSKTYHGDEKKMGLLIEDALNFTPPTKRMKAEPMPC